MVCAPRLCSPPTSEGMWVLMDGFPAVEEAGEGAAEACPRTRRWRRRHSWSSGRGRRTACRWPRWPPPRTRRSPADSRRRFGRRRTEAGRRRPRRGQSAQPNARVYLGSGWVATGREGGRADIQVRKASFTTTFPPRFFRFFSRAPWMIGVKTRKTRKMTTNG